MPLPFNVPPDFSVATDEELTTVQRQANEAAKPLIANMSNLSDDEKTTLRDLSETVSKARGEQTVRRERAAADAALVDQFSTLDAELTEPATVETPVETVTEPAAPAAPASTAFSARPVPRVRDVAANTTAPDVSSVGGNTDLGTVTVKYAPRTADAGLDLAEFGGLKQMGMVLVDQLARYEGFRGDFDRRPLAVFERNFDASIRGGTEESGSQSHEFALLEHASALFKNQTAAAAYCAPSLTIYDLCELETGDGILPISEIQISRGGIFFTTGPDFASIFNGAGYWNYTEAQVIANTIKPCMEIPCPPFTELRLVNLGVCITAGILQRRGYPELIARFMRGAMIAHMHRINAFVIAQMAAGSTLVDLSPPPAGSLVGDTTASGLLAAAEMVATDIRSRNRMGLNAPIEAVFPHWVMPQLRADVSRRTGVDMISVTDATIRSWFSDRNLNLRLVYDWQDAFSGVPTGPGAALPGITSFAADVEFLLYPPGTWVKGVDDTIRLETIYDSTKLSTNQYTALFTEEGVLVAKVCPDSRRVVYPLCPTGATTEPVVRSCA
jgi:hypothetical protein